MGRAAAAGLAVAEDSWLIGTSRAFSLELAERGWLGMTWPVEEGGHGRSPLERFVVFEALIAAGAPLATSWFADRQIGPTLLQFGTAEQRRRFLPDIVAGTSAWSIGMSEPDAGSDVASIRTRAERHGPDWVVNGTKVWTSGAADADWCYLIARTDPDAPPHAGLSELVVDLHSPGVEILPITDMTGNRHFCEVVYTDVHVPAANLVGEENGSFRQVMRQMEHERGGIDRLVSNRALFEAARAAGRRRRPPRPSGTGRPGDGLQDRSAAGAARGAGSGPCRVLGRHQDVLHRVRAAGRRLLRPGGGGRCPAGGPRGPRRGLRARLHDHGGHDDDPAQHPGRAPAGVAPRAAPLTRKA